MHDNITKFNLSFFQNKLKETHLHDVPEDIILKARHLKGSYACFNSFYDPKMIWEKKKFTKKEKQYTKPKSRFHIIIPDFTDTSLNKRQLTGYLNKLSERNKTVIYEKIREIIHKNKNEEYFMLIWSYIKSCDIELYMGILDLFDKPLKDKMITKLWNDYITNKEWIPPNFIFENNLLLLNDEYELYCDYNKWKKEVINLNYVWIKLDKDITFLLNDIYDYFMMYNSKQTGHADVFKYVTDIFLEQIYRIMKQIPNDEIRDKISKLNIDQFESSTKFIIYNILEKK